MNLSGIRKRKRPVSDYQNIILKNRKKALCCRSIFESGCEVKFMSMHSKKMALIGIPNGGTFAIHKIKLNPRSYDL